MNIATHYIKIISKYGDQNSFFGRLLPAIRTYISLPCRIGRTNILKFSISAFIGSIMWNSLFPFVGMQVGNNWEHNDNYSVYLEIMLLSV